ncbi:MULTISPECIES: class F sortase [Streptomyces]|uniref:Class F sortase n=1 Tax=Streptomyces poriferorum TaxID=2798799 RepID=A0ABY9INZ2_9ACTN|nr:MULTISPECIES: class F sortase [unclassified Streptomyces]MDP5314530.1 class F sortase [Streptomyces sp. Alt4]WLQ56559.1 class F sortase [Streptomyces sp. Alt2]WSI65576.1 class F sortase [Streptomyces sp. NBC_01336]
MAAPQSPGSPSSRNASDTVTLGRALLWPAAVAGLGMLLIYNSIGPSADDKPPAPLVAAAPAAPAPAAPAAPASSPAAAVPRQASPSPSPTPTTAPALARSVPKRLKIPAIAVDAPFTPLSIGASGRLDAPPPNDKNLVGWFQGGVTPGERGASIVAGHVDTLTGPAVFLQLRFLRPGSTVDITRTDGTVATFKVDTVETFSKAKFPDKRVYADTPDAQLRLITCGGTYDKKAKDYVDNVVVFAHLDSAKKG